MMLHLPTWFIAVTLLVIGLHAGCSLGTCEPDRDIPVLKPAFVPPSTQSLELLPGDDAELVCEVKRDVDPENPPRFGLIIWWCNSTYPECHTDRQSMSSIYNKFLNVTKSKEGDAPYLRSEFTLTDLMPSQSGWFYCVAFSDDSSSSKCPGNVGVDVIIKERSDPTIQKHTFMRDVVKGSAFNLSCVATGFPTPMFKWTKDGKPVDGGENGTFMRDDASEDDAGMYRCQALNDMAASPLSPKIEVKVHDNINEPGLTRLQYGLLIASAVVLAILLFAIIFRLSKLRSNMTCFTIHRTNISGDNNKTIHAQNVHVYNEGGVNRPTRRESSHERRTFLHMHDVFIHNHSSDNQFALMIRSKLTDRESHLKVGLWSEVERPERSSGRNKLLRLRLLNCSRIVIIASEDYLKYDYHALLSALAKSRAKPESIRSKIIIVRVLEETKIPKDMTKDVMTTLEYNVDTDSCYFWPKFMKVAMPDQKEILYWV